MKIWVAIRQNRLDRIDRIEVSTSVPKLLTLLDARMADYRERILDGLEVTAFGWKVVCREVVFEQHEDRYYFPEGTLG